MEKLKLIYEETPINVPHDTYRRECRYTKGVHIPYEDFLEILDHMPQDTKFYFDFHNVGKKIYPGTYLNGYSGLTRSIAKYYQNEKGIKADCINGHDFYVKII